MWRCFQDNRIRCRRCQVFSTHVEMFLLSLVLLIIFKGFLHACGDVSGCIDTIDWVAEFSPRMWRCFQLNLSDFPTHWVFSTHVEMFRFPAASKDEGARFLHACGDVSALSLLSFESNGTCSLASMRWGV